MSQISKNDKKKKNAQADLDSLQQGRKTVTTLFKKPGDAGSMVNKIENVSKIFVC